MYKQDLTLHNLQELMRRKTKQIKPIQNIFFTKNVVLISL